MAKAQTAPTHHYPAIIVVDDEEVVIGHFRHRNVAHDVAQEAADLLNASLRCKLDTKRQAKLDELERLRARYVHTLTLAV